MITIAENIQILSPPVKRAVEEREATVIQDLARREDEAGAPIIDLNIGSQKKLGAEIVPWIVRAVRDVTDLPLLLDTTDLAAMEAGLKECARPAPLKNVWKA